MAVREAPTEAGPADYVLFVDSQAVDVIEDKKECTTLTGVESQTRKYQNRLSRRSSRVPRGPRAFGYESTGTETRFTSLVDPVRASRRVSFFHRPETLARWQNDYADGTGVSDIRGGNHLQPDLDTEGLWPAQAQVSATWRSHDCVATDQRCSFPSIAARRQW